jgi:aerobic-type carbon monoxide dehydrogenase small subunit (CoxS/CutS family)
MQLTVNGRLQRVADPQGTLLDLLRDDLALTGTKLVCDRGECGACTVLLDGRTVYACLTLAAACDGTTITPIEGLGAVDGSMNDLQEAFITHDAAQCGFCTPGQLIAAHDLLVRNAAPSESAIVAAMSGNLCRCGTYPKIVRAIQAVAAARHESSATSATPGVPRGA